MPRTRVFRLGETGAKMVDEIRKEERIQSRQEAIARIIAGYTKLRRLKNRSRHILDLLNQDGSSVELLLVMNGERRDITKIAKRIFADAP